MNTDKNEKIELDVPKTVRSAVMGLFTYCRMKGHGGVIFAIRRRL